MGSCLGRTIRSFRTSFKKPIVEKRYQGTLTDSSISKVRTVTKCMSDILGHWEVQKLFFSSNNSSAFCSLFSSRCDSTIQLKGLTQMRKGI